MQPVLVELEAARQLVRDTPGAGSPRETRRFPRHAFSAKVETLNVPVTAAILAGGQATPARRTRQDRACASDRRSILERQVAVLREITASIVVVTTARARPGARGVRDRRDRLRGAGPLGGIYTAIQIASPGRCARGRVRHAVSDRAVPRAARRRGRRSRRRGAPNRGRLAPAVRGLRARARLSRFGGGSRAGGSKWSTRSRTSGSARSDRRRSPVRPGRDLVLQHQHAGRLPASLGVLRRW